MFFKKKQDKVNGEILREYIFSLLDEVNEFKQMHELDMKALKSAAGYIESTPRANQSTKVGDLEKHDTITELQETIEVLQNKVESLSLDISTLRAMIKFPPFPKPVTTPDDVYYKRQNPFTLTYS